jgi:glycosyltransferase involved in cell wall biosynthesis
MGARASREAALIVTPTEAVARQVRETLQPDCPVRSVLLGATPLAVPTDAADRRRAHGLERPYLAFVGTAEPRKGVDLLVAALAGTTGLSSLDLVVIGPPGWGEVSVAELAAAHGVSARVRVLGPVDDADLAAVVNGSRALVMPSRAEGFGLPVVEAMRLGVPVVTSDDPALVEVAAGAAWTCQREDVDSLGLAIEAAISDGPARIARIVRGRERARELTWQGTARQMWDLYAEVML